MERELGYKKVVYKDGDYTKVAQGETSFDDEFVKVKTKNGTVWIGKRAVISIKEVTTQ